MLMIVVLGMVRSCNETALITTEGVGDCNETGPDVATEGVDNGGLLQLMVKDIAAKLHLI